MEAHIVQRFDTSQKRDAAKWVRPDIFLTGQGMEGVVRAGRLGH
jgi:hypothetical protein